MQDLLKPTDVVGEEQIRAAVNALVDVAGNAGESGRDRVHAAETILRYGVRDPYWSPAPDEPEGEE